MTYFDNLWRHPQFYSFRPNEIRLENGEATADSNDAIKIKNFLFMPWRSARFTHVHFPNNLRPKLVTKQFKRLLSQLNPSLQTSDAVSDAHEANQTLLIYIEMSDRQDD